MKSVRFMPAWLAGLMFFIAAGCAKPAAEFYTAEDFIKVPKVDMHFHYETPDTRYLLMADSLNLRFVSPNVDAGRSIDEQFEIAKGLKKQFPEKFAFFGTFAVDRFGEEDFAGQIIARIDEAMAAGATGIKIWKNIGMALQDADSNYVMADHPAFEPVFRYLEEKNIPLLAHLGEPRNCWLPLEEMTLDNDRRYFERNPQYHMYLHPEMPSYEDQIESRDNLLKLYPGISFTGAHLGSQEWSVDEVAKALDRFPSYQTEFSARIGHLQLQAMTDHAKVRDFMIRYQDRIMYGSDVGVSERNPNFESVSKGLQAMWLEHWLFLATDQVIAVKDLGGREVKGLQLPAEVVDKIFSKNAVKFFNL